MPLQPVSSERNHQVAEPPDERNHQVAERFWRQNPYSMLLEAKKNGRKPKIPTPIRKPKDPGLPKLSSKTRTGHNVN